MLHSQAQMHSSFLMIRRTEKRVGRPGYEDLRVINSHQNANPSKVDGESNRQSSTIR